MPSAGYIGWVYYGRPTIHTYIHTQAASLARTSRLLSSTQHQMQGLQNLPRHAIHLEEAHLAYYYMCAHHGPCPAQPSACSRCMSCIGSMHDSGLSATLQCLWYSHTHACKGDIAGMARHMQPMHLAHMLTVGVPPASPLLAWPYCTVLKTWPYCQPPTSSTPSSSSMTPMVQPTPPAITDPAAAQVKSPGALGCPATAPDHHPLATTRHHCTPMWYWQPRWVPHMTQQSRAARQAAFSHNRRCSRHQSCSPPRHRRCSRRRPQTGPQSLRSPQSPLGRRCPRTWPSCSS